MRNESSVQPKRKMKRSVRLRLIVYSLIASILFSVIFVFYLQQAKKERALEKERIELEERLEEVELNRELLKERLEQLDDDEYIEKLARQKYFVGKEDEIIFTLPEEEEENEKEKEAEKE